MTYISGLEDLFELKELLPDHKMILRSDTNFISLFVRVQFSLTSAIAATTIRFFPYGRISITVFYYL